MKLSLNPGAFELFEQKITDIQLSIDRGILNPETSLRFLREARTELFKLRQILRNGIVTENDNPGPDSPEAA